MDFDQIVAKFPGERYQAHLGLLFEEIYGEESKEEVTIFITQPKNARKALRCTNAIAVVQIRKGNRDN